MRKAILIAAAVLVVVCASFAGQHGTRMEVVLNGSANSGGSQTYVVGGFVEKVYMAPPATGGLSTGDVTISYQPVFTNMAAINIATGTVTADIVWYPVADRTDVAGTALTSDEPGRIVLADGLVTFSVTNVVPTNFNWRAYIITSDE